MAGLFTLPKIYIDIETLPKLAPGVNIGQLIESIRDIIAFFVLNLNSFNYKDFNKEFADIEKMTKTIISKLDSRLVEDYLILKSGIIHEETDGKETYTAVINKYKDALKLIQLISNTSHNKKGHPKNNSLTNDYHKRAFVSRLLEIYKQATGQFNNYSKTKFCNFAKDVLDNINRQHPGLDKGHNITISFMDYLKRSAKNTKKKTI